MSGVMISQAWPAAGRPFTVTELDRIPDDGRRYELLDGALIVSRRPTTIHQVVSGRLLVVEIRSPSTAFIDLSRKKAAYEAASGRGPAIRADAK